jgi:DNA-binding MarR family transcriptional regulator
MGSIEEEIKSSKFQSEEHKARINVLFTANWLSNQTKAILKPFGISPEQFNVLRILRGSAPVSMCQKDILSRMVAKQSNLTLIINKLKAKKLIKVQTSSKDKREYMISILPSGLNTLKKIDETFKNSSSFKLGLNTSEAFHLNALLDKLRSTD